ncbi:MAG: YraN family protein [Corynebacterium sp.]|nr:YraN family protein [Corynebacterium sp.]
MPITMLASTHEPSQTTIDAADAADAASPQSADAADAASPQSADAFLSDVLAAVSMFMPAADSKAVPTNVRHVPAAAIRTPKYEIMPHSHLSDEDAIDLEHLPNGQARFYYPQAKRLKPAALGAFGERIAWRFLADHGWEFVARNIGNKFGEIDILARNCRGGSCIRCVEIKTRCSKEIGEAAQAVTYLKIRKMRRTFIQWVKTHQVSWTSCVCDAVAIDVIDNWVYITFYGGVDVDGAATR